MDTTLLNKVSQLSALCAQLQAQLSVTHTKLVVVEAPQVEDPLLPWLREVTADWTKDEAVLMLRNMHTLPDDLAGIRLPLLKHLHVTFGLDKSDARANDNYALKWCARNGHLEVVKYLKEAFGLDKSDAQANANHALRLSAENGHLEVVKYLKEAFGLDKSDARAQDNYALRWCAENGHLEVVKYLKEAFGLDKSDAQANDNYALKWSSVNGHLEVVKYLKEAFELDKSPGPRSADMLIASLKRKRPAL